MHLAAVEKAESRLRVAKKALNELVGTLQFNQFVDNWYVFLTGFKGVYMTLEQGSKASAQSKQWFGNKQRERRQDPLLQYIYQARNDDEHGLGLGAQHVEGTFMQDMPWSGIPREKLTISGLPPVYRLDLENQTKVEETWPRAQLIQVHGRSPSEVYDPPTMHLGIPLTDTSPLAVGNLAIVYLEALVAEAAALV